MNTQDLMEMASLDALGLLDPDERDAFERAFRAAAPAVQAQIRREQLRFSGMDDLLPQIDPPLGLRARVIAAVREAMQTMATRRADAAPVLRMPSGVSRMWRIGAVGAMAACVVLGFSTFWALRETRGLTEAQQSAMITDSFTREFGHRFEANFFNPSGRFVAFHPAADAPDIRGARATLMFDPAKKSGLLIVQDLPAPGEYEVLVEDAQGNQTSAVLTFTAGPGKKAETVQNLNTENAKNFIIRSQASGKTILKSNGI